MTDTKAVWCELDITESLRQIQKDKKNFGWCVHVYSRDKKNPMGVFFASSRSETMELRPKLIVKARLKK